MKRAIRKIYHSKMQGIKTLQEYADLILKHKNNPHELALLHIEIAAKYAYLADIAKDLQIERAVYWQKKFAGEKTISDATLENQWRLTEGGGKEIRMKHELKALQNLMGAIKTSSVITSIEQRESKY